jgi:hypothetical protein
MMAVKLCRLAAAVGTAFTAAGAAAGAAPTATGAAAACVQPLLVLPSPAQLDVQNIAISTSNTSKYN